MKIVIACDSFKGSASSLEVANSLAAGMLSIKSDLEILKLAVADGGEGTSQALLPSLGADRVSVEVHNPLGQRIVADYALADGLAVIDMAAASGLSLLGEEDLDPYRASTFGTGEMILDAVRRGAGDIYLGLGGSATNDGGIGMAMALGVTALTAAGHPIKPGPAGLADLHSLDLSTLDSRLKNVQFYAICDVTNPLSGANGASYVYGPQKGVKAKDLEKLDQILHVYGQMLEQVSGREVINMPGAGAAGGMGAALVGFLNAELKPGIDTVLDLLCFDQQIQGADLLVTGEGKLDQSSLYGKAAIGIARRAKKLSLPVFAVVGSFELDSACLHEKGIDLVFPLMNERVSLETAMAEVGTLLFETGKKIISILESDDY